MATQGNRDQRPQRPPNQTQPLETQGQAATLVDLIRTFAGNNLTGIYAQERDGAITLLVVTERSLQRSTRLALLQTLLRHSTTAWPVAAFFVRASDIASGQPPTPLELYYDETRRAAIEREVIGPRWLQWPELPTEMADLTRTIGLFQQAGSTLIGTPFNELAPSSPTATAAVEETQSPSAPEPPTGGQQLTLAPDS